MNYREWIKKNFSMSFPRIFLTLQIEGECLHSQKKYFPHFNSDQQQQTTAALSSKSHLINIQQAAAALHVADWRHVIAWYARVYVQT